MTLTAVAPNPDLAPVKKLTAHRFLLYAGFWVVAVVLPVLAVVTGLVWGTVRGAGRGLSEAVGWTVADLKKLWAYLETR